MYGLLLHLLSVPFEVPKINFEIDRRKYIYNPLFCFIVPGYPLMCQRITSPDDDDDSDYEPSVNITLG